MLRKLGSNGWGRVYQFRNYYESGWGEKGLVLSPRALDAFFRFLEEATFPEDRKSPSVFLTDRGGIELCWEDRNGKSVQVEFTGTGAEFYTEDFTWNGQQDPATTHDSPSVSCQPGVRDIVRGVAQQS